MQGPTLFDSEYNTAVHEMIRELKLLLATCTDDYERGELVLAIKSWQAALEPIAPTSQTQPAP